MKIRSILASMSLMGVFAASGAVVPGVWNSEFAASRDLAEREGVPMVVVWGNTSCGFCNKLADAVKTPVVSAWTAQHPILLVMKHEEYKSRSADYVAADKWLDALDDVDFDGNPHVGLYWRRADGTVVVSKGFTGRIGTMPATTPKDDLAGQFAATLDLYFGTYGQGPRFGCGDTELDRLEATSSTSVMYVPLASAAKGGTLKVVSPTGATSTYSVSSSATEVRISVPYGKAGQKTTLELRGTDGGISDTTHITYVGVRPCSITYPKWIGESFDYGEWTMDYAAAKAKGGYVLVMFTGTLWCPYCHGAETSLLADPKFTQWAKANSVSLVSFDQGNSSSPATAAGNGKARLLTWEAGESHIVTGEEPSGAYYLSSKGISRLDAQSRIALTTKYTSEWLQPGSTAARLGNPTFLLVKNDKVVGRFAGFRDGFVYDTAENIFRLNDLLKLVSRDDESSDYIQTTKKSLVLGETADVEFQVNSATKCFRLSGKKACCAGFALTNATAATAVKFEVVTAAKTLASGTGKVVARVSAEQFAEGVWLKATAVYPSGKLGKSSAFAAQIASEERESGSGDDDGPGFDPDGKPCLGWEEYQLDIYQGFAAAKSFNICNVEGAKSVSVKKVSGSLPSGVTLKYDKKTGRVVLSGTPKKAGTCTVSYKVTAKVGSKSQTGTASTFTFTVADPAALNPFIGKAYSNVTVPLYGRGYLAGILTVSITKANKVTAKYAGTESKTAKFTGTWSALDGETHDARMTASVKKGPSLVLSLSPDGLLSAELSNLVGYSCFVEDDEDGLFGDVKLSDGSAGGFADYVGSYTVTLPDTNSGEPCGTGFLTLKLTKSAAKTGKVTWSGVLPDGTAVSGNSTLAVEDEEHASLVVFQRKGVNVLGAELLIRSDGAETWADAGGNEIIVEKNGLAYVLRRKSGETALTEHAIYGGYLPDKVSPADICDALGLDEGLEMTLGGEPLASVTATAKGFSCSKGVLTSLSYAKTTGIFSGKAKVTIDGKAVTGTIRGVLLVNWISCGCGETDIDRPYGSGTFYANGVSLPLDLNAKKE